MINLDAIHEGDVFFTSSNTFMGNLIRLSTNSNVSHCGQFIKPYGGKLLYALEMKRDLFSKQDMKLNKIPDNIVCVRRPLGIYKTTSDRIKFRNRIIKWHEQLTIDYDDAEFLSHTPLFGSKEDKNKNKMICSRLVYLNLCIDGSEIKNSFYDNAVTPDDLYNNPWLEEVDGWYYE